MNQAVRTKRTGRSTKVAGKPPPQLKSRLIKLPERITEGSVLLKKGTVLPSGWRGELSPMGGWDLVCGDHAFVFDGKLREAGWHFFFMVPAVEASAIGLNPRKTFTDALRRVTHAVDERGLNAVEVTAIERRRWWGLHYVRLTAHPRHVRNSPFLRDLDPHHYPAGLSDFKRIFTVRNRNVSQIKAM